MTAIRTARAAEGRFVQISNVAARDERLTLEALGVITKVLSYPPDWTFSAEWLETVVPNGRRSVRSALRLLEECGYFRRSKKSGGRGRWEWDQLISDEPLPPAEPEEGNQEEAEHASEGSSDRSTSDENRPPETTCENTTSSQVSSSDRFSPDDNRPDTPNTGDLIRSQHGGSETPPESPRDGAEPDPAPAKRKRPRKRTERTPEQQAIFDAADEIAHGWWDDYCPKHGIPVMAEGNRGPKAGFPGFRSFLEKALAAGIGENELKFALVACGVAWPSRTALEKAVTDRRGRNPRHPASGRPTNQHHETQAADRLAEVF